MTGLGVLYVNKHLPEVATVFTTHATSIGRSIAGIISLFMIIFCL